MKKVFLILVIACLLFAFSGCVQPKEEPTEPEIELTVLEEFEALNGKASEFKKLNEFKLVKSSSEEGIETTIEFAKKAENYKVKITIAGEIINYYKNGGMVYICEEFPGGCIPAEEEVELEQMEELIKQATESAKETMEAISGTEATEVTKGTIEVIAGRECQNFTVNSYTTCVDTKYGIDLTGVTELIFEVDEMEITPPLEHI